MILKDQNERRKLVDTKRHRKPRLWLMVAMVLALAVGGSLIALAAPILNDLTHPGDTATINGAIFEVFTPTDPTGSGVFGPFVRISTNKAVEHGYNTDWRPLEFDENKSKQFTRSWLLSDIPLIPVDYVMYREFQLDINQEKKYPDSLLSLDKLEIYITDDPEIHGKTDHTFSSAASTLVYDMDGGGDNSVIMDYANNEGSGKRDLRVLVPDDLFDRTKQYVVLYSLFGEENGNNDGYEEWGVALYPSKSGIKFNDLNGNGVNDGEPGLEGWTIYVDYNDDGVWDGDEPFAITESDGSYIINSVGAGQPLDLPQTWKVREVLDEHPGWIQTYPASGYHEETFNWDQDYTDNDFGNRRLVPDVDVTKSVTPTVSKATDTVTYTITVTNTGETMLYKDSIIDTVLGDLSGSFATDLAAGASETHTFD